MNIKYGINRLFPYGSTPQTTAVAAIISLLRVNNWHTQRREGTHEQSNLCEVMQAMFRFSKNDQNNCKGNKEE
jgi:hypothetical protein